jgi:hypothetical protein
MGEKTIFSTNFTNPSEGKRPTTHEVKVIRIKKTSISGGFLSSPTDG